MSEVTGAEKYLLEQIRRGDQEAWGRLIGRYHGRLLAFARSKLDQQADAEDVVQETFVGLLKSITAFRGQSSLETYLFAILRRNIVNNFRNKKAARLCLLQDVYCTAESDEEASDVFGKFAGPDPTASSYARGKEQREIEVERLADALRELVDRCKKSQNFRDLQIMELLLYCHLTNKDIAAMTGISDSQVALIKHRNVKRIRERIGVDENDGEVSIATLENLLTKLWQRQRISCLKRSTVGAYVLGTLDEKWREYVDFHLNVLGCEFCRANRDDLERQNDNKDENSKMLAKVMDSTVGFLSRP